MATETKREFREGIDTVLLIIAFLAGIGSAVILKIMGLPAWVPALAAGAVIIAYAFATYYSSAARLEPEQIGDNCYYLGFCITLASLAYTLSELGKASDDAVMLSNVISGFGVALSSTVVGVMARVVLLQFRVDLAARDKEARSQLNQVMRSFHGEMQSSVTSTRETITQIRQTLDEHTRETIEHNKRMQESFEQRIAALMEEAVTGVKAAMNEVVDNGKDMNRRLSASSRANMTTAEKAMQDSMTAVTEDLKRATVRLEEEMERANASSIRSLERVIIDVSAAMKLLSEEAAKSIDASRESQSGEMTEAVKAVASNVFELANQIGAQKDKLREALDGFAQQTDVARLEVSALVKESSASREDTRKAAQTVEAAALKIAASVERVENTAAQTAARTAPQTEVASPRTLEPRSAALPAETQSARNRDTPQASGAAAASPSQPHGTMPPPASPSEISAALTDKLRSTGTPGADLKSTTAAPPVNGSGQATSEAQQGRDFGAWLGLRK